MNSPSITWMASTPRNRVMTRTKKMGVGGKKQSSALAWLVAIGVSVMTLAPHLPQA